MASLPRLPQNAVRTTDAVCGTPQRLRSVHGRGTRAVSAVGPITLLEDIEVLGLVWRAASVIGAREPRRRGRLPRAERCKRMESQVRIRGCAGAAGFLPVCRDTRLVCRRLREGHSSTKNLPI